jgi:hypothetical protein
MGLGIEAGASFRCGGPVELAPGDVLFAFTDGITEASPAPEGAKERDLFETDRLASLLVEIRERSARGDRQRRPGGHRVVAPGGAARRRRDDGRRQVGVTGPNEAGPGGEPPGPDGALSNRNDRPGGPTDRGVS